MADNAANNAAATSEPAPVAPARIDLKILSPGQGADIPHSIDIADVPVTATIQDVKARITLLAPSRPGPAHQRLIYQGRVLTNLAATLADVFGAEVQRHRQFTLHLVVRQPGNATPYAASNSTPVSRVATPQDGMSAPPPLPPPANTTPPLPIPGNNGLPQPVPPFLPQQRMPAFPAFPRQFMPNGGPPPPMPFPHQQPFQQMMAHQQLALQQHHQHQQLLAQHQQQRAHAVQQTTTTVPPAADGATSPPSDMPGQQPRSTSQTRNVVGPDGVHYRINVNQTTTFVPIPPPNPALPPFSPQFAQPRPFPHLVPGQAQGQQPPAPIPNFAYPSQPVEAQLQEMQELLADTQRFANDVAVRMRDGRLTDDDSAEAVALRDRLQQAQYRLRSNLPLDVRNGQAAAAPPSSVLPIDPAQNSAQPALLRPSSASSLPDTRAQPTQSTEGAPLEATTTTLYLLSSPAGPHALLYTPQGIYTGAGPRAARAIPRSLARNMPRVHGPTPNQGPTSTSNVLPPRMQNDLAGPLPQPLMNQANEWHTQHQQQQQQGQDGHQADHRAHQYAHEQAVQNVQRAHHQIVQQAMQHAQQVRQQEHQAMQQGPQPPAQQAQQEQLAAVAAPPAVEENLLAPIQPLLNSLWFLLRILLFAYFFLGSNLGWRRPLILFSISAIFFLLRGLDAGAGVQTAVRAWWEGVVGIPAQRPDNAAPAPVQQAQPAPVDQRNPNAPVATAAGANVGAGDAREVGLQQQQQQPPLSPWRARFRPLERALALFVASLWPGVGERTVQARQAEDERIARGHREAEERERAQEAARPRSDDVDAPATSTSAASTSEQGVESAMDAAAGAPAQQLDREPDEALASGAEVMPGGPSLAEGTVRERRKAEDGVRAAERDISGATEGNEAGVGQSRGVEGSESAHA